MKINKYQGNRYQHGKGTPRQLSSSQCKANTEPTNVMSFFVDIVTEDSFYENLTLGVVKLLENSPCVKNVKVERRSACERSALSSWEQRHCCMLPEDLKSFYASIDGFLLTWCLDISGIIYSFD